MTSVRMGIVVGMVGVASAGLLFACTNGDEVSETHDPTGVVGSELKGGGGHCTLSGSSGYGGSSSSGLTSCQSNQVYTCSAGDTSITCTCDGVSGTGSCSCGTKTFAYGCTNNADCTIGRTQLKACGLQ
jgi:hypothetical protein